MDDLILWAQMDALEQNLASIEKILESKEIRDRFPAISTRINRGIRRQIKKVQDIRKGLETIRDEGKMEKAITTAWGKYVVVRRESWEIFRECHDFLSGIAVRDMQLDKTICSVADKLVTRYAEDADVKWNAITVPGEEPLSATMALIIRLRFPEWDIWNLPFTAHEFGHVVANETKDFQDFLKEQRFDEQGKLYLSELFADAFATYMLGPAYACASILLRFDPSVGYVDAERHPSHAKRVYFILKMLNEMDASLAGSGPLGHRKGPYKDMMDVLQGAWDGALKRAQPGDGLTDEDKRLLNLWFSRIYDILDLEFGPLVMPARWNMTEMLSGELLEDKPASEKLTGREELRDIPNAAWHCRLNNPPQKVSEIGRRAAELCEEIIKRTEERAPETRLTQF